MDISLEDDDNNITSFKKASKFISFTPELLKLERLLCVSLDNTSTPLKLTFKSSNFCLESFPNNWSGKKWENMKYYNNFSYFLWLAIWRQFFSCLSAAHDWMLTILVSSAGHEVDQVMKGLILNRMFPSCNCCCFLILSSRNHFSMETENGGLFFTSYTPKNQNIEKNNCALQLTFSIFNLSDTSKACWNGPAT